MDSRGWDLQRPCGRGNESLASKSFVDNDFMAEMRCLIGAHMQDISGLAQGSVAAAIQFLLAMFSLFYLLRDRAAFVRGLRDLLPLSDSECDRVLSARMSTAAAPAPAL